MSNPDRVNFGFLVGVLVGLYGNWLLMIGQKIYDLQANETNFYYSIFILVCFFIASILPLRVGVSKAMTFDEKVIQYKNAGGFFLLIALIATGFAHGLYISITVRSDLQLVNSVIYSTMGLVLWITIWLLVILDHLRPILDEPEY